MLNNVQFANPEFFWLLLIIPLLICHKIFAANKNNPTLKYSDTTPFEGTKNWKVRLRELPYYIRLIIIALICVILARPQTTSGEQKVTTEGIDIVLAMDVSTSMLAEDLQPNRLKAAKEAASEFIDNRPNDRIGLVVFAGQSFTQSPITIDHTVLKELLDKLETGMVQDGTAIGMGLATSVSRLKDSKAKSRVVILLTDGDNNAGSVSPETAAEIAKTFGIRVYTIGVGTKGKAKYPVKTPFGMTSQYIEVNINEPLLTNIADITDGKYFRATDTKSLESIYKQIDQLEKTKVDVAYFSSYTELFYPIAIAVIVLFLIEILLRFTIFRKLP
ncbi:VWA domain-containing protein [bacterium]|nr:MAG: VWA domain-containing protein [bacterium]